MILAKVLSRIYKKNGIILEDSTGQKYICGSPRKDNPLTLKLLKDNLRWKLILDPELEFPEAYMRNEILIQNGSLEEFLMSLVENLGREEITTASFLSITVPITDSSFFSIMVSKAFCEPEPKLKLTDSLRELPMFCFTSSSKLFSWPLKTSILHVANLPAPVHRKSRLQTAD